MTTPYLIGGAVIAALATAGYLYWKGHDAGSSEIRNEVQTETIRTLEQARKQKESANEEVRTTPYFNRVDQLQ